MTTHTPGPWHIESWHYKQPERTVLTVQTHADAVAQACDLWPPDECAREAEANARLIAAAPDLLAALDVACEFLEDRMDVRDGQDGPRPDAFMSLFQQLDEVRAKARGERWPR